MTVIPLTDNGSTLVCPSCSGTNTHFDQVFISAREEDATPQEVVVHAVSGEVAIGGRGEAPTGAMAGAGRRHRMAVAGYCEDCRAPLALVFTQHKGQTLVEWSPQATWLDHSDDTDEEPY